MVAQYVSMVSCQITSSAVFLHTRPYGVKLEVSRSSFGTLGLKTKVNSFGVEQILCIEVFGPSRKMCYSPK